MHITGYTYRAATYCGPCTIAHLPTGPGEAFDGWDFTTTDLGRVERYPPARLTTEANLDELAATFGFDRYDEWSYDSDDFPKVIFSIDVVEFECEGCGG